MKDHYQIKFVRDGKTVYGIVDSFSDRAKEAAKRRVLIVEDAVLPTSYEVRESEVTDIKTETGVYDHTTGDFKDCDEYFTFVQAEHRKAMTASDAIEKGVGVGSMFRVGVGDGFAAYVVTKLNKKTCKVEWRGFCLDRWTDHHFGWGGTFPLADVARYVEGERAANRIFGKKAKASS